MTVETSIPAAQPEPWPFLNKDGLECFVFGYDEATQHFGIRMGDVILEVSFHNEQHVLLRSECVGSQMGQLMNGLVTREMLIRHQESITNACRAFYMHRLSKRPARVMRAP